MNPEMVSRAVLALERIDTSGVVLSLLVMVGTVALIFIAILLSRIVGELEQMNQEKK